MEPAASPSVFVHNIPHSVTQAQLLHAFTSHFGTAIVDARVVTDRTTGNARYGFVDFADEDTCSRALATMQGTLLFGRPMQLKRSTARPTPSRRVAQPGPGMGMGMGMGGYNSPASSSTVYVGDVDPSVDVAMLRSAFSPFGQISNIHQPLGRNYAFVTFESPAAAAAAIQHLHKSTLGNSVIRCGHGRGTGNPAQPQGSQFGPQFGGHGGPMHGRGLGQSGSASSLFGSGPGSGFGGATSSATHLSFGGISPGLFPPGLGPQASFSHSQALFPLALRAPVAGGLFL
jgi:RNA recognition motif-containing protein